MTRDLLCILLILCCTCLSHGQWVQDFDMGDLSNWSGDVNDFIINDDKRLQLDAPEAGTSLILTEVDFASDLSWEFNVELDFDPSGSNSLEIWLALDNQDPSLANGYKIELGESGAEDAIKFLALDNGSETLLAEGPMGQVSKAFNLDFKFLKDPSGFWTLETKSEATGFYEEAFQVSHNMNLPANGFFGIGCKYTIGRADLFSFDDFRIGTPIVDIDGPQLLSATVVQINKIVLQFDEPLDPGTVENLSNYDIPIAISEVRYDDNAPAEVCLILSEALPQGNPVGLEVSSLTDRNGNEMAPTSVELLFFDFPMKGDLVINEILYDPVSGNTADFVELLNASDKFLKLDSLHFSRPNSNNVDVAIPNGYELRPGEIIAFTPDTNEILDVYLPEESYNLQELKITNYVQKLGTVSIILKLDSDTMTIDSFDYSDDYHSSLLTQAQLKGISLERISGSAPTNDPDNWYSAAASVNFATPGYANSQRSLSLNPGDEMIQLENKVFSPDGDDYQDLLRLNYSLDKTGFIANVTIYDDRGRRVQDMAANKLLGQQGTLFWDGILEDGQVAPTGMYILHYDIFHDDGTVLTDKLVFVLAQYLNR